MISIIICSRKEDISAKLRQNIKETIGTEHEIIVIDNSKGAYSIFSAYNSGIRRSEGEILCFCHEDILFHTSSWGTSIQKVFSAESIGVVGVIGSHFLPRAPMYWWSSPYISQYSVNNDKGVAQLNDNREFFHGDVADVVTVDGVCFFIPRILFDSIRFDDRTFQGFHLYDMDICMQVQALGKRVCVTDVLTIEHFWSEDSIRNEKYMAVLNQNLELFYHKWEKNLPMVRGIEEPEIVIQRMNNLCTKAYEAVRIQQSKAYRLGRMLLKPWKAFKK